MGLERYKSMNVSRANEMNKNKRRHSQTLCQGKRQKAARLTTPFERNPGVVNTSELHGARAHAKGKQRARGKATRSRAKSMNTTQPKG